MTTPTTPSDDLEAAAKPWPLIGYAPGGYMCRCTDCNTEFTGDKRAVHCVTCAAKVANALLSERLADKAEIKTLDQELCLAMSEKGFPTGHGDTLVDLLREFIVQCDEQLSISEARALSAEAAQARAEEERDRAMHYAGELGEIEADYGILRAAFARNTFLLAVAAECAEDQSEFLLGWKNQALNAEAALRASQEALKAVAAMLDRYNAPTTDDSDGSLLSLANRIEAKVYADAVAAAKFVADVRIIEPHLDAVICYASDINEHPPNGAVMRIRRTLAQVEGGGEDKGSIPGTRPDDLRASRGEGSGS